MGWGLSPAVLSGLAPAAFPRVLHYCKPFLSHFLTTGDSTCGHRALMRHRIHQLQLEENAKSGKCSTCHKQHLPQTAQPWKTRIWNTLHNHRLNVPVAPSAQHSLNPQLPSPVPSLRSTPKTWPRSQIPSALPEQPLT